MCDAAVGLFPAAAGALSSASEYAVPYGVTDWSLLGCNQGGETSMQVGLAYQLVQLHRSSCSTCCTAKLAGLTA